MKTVLNILLLQVLLVNFANSQNIFVEIKNEISFTESKFALSLKNTDKSIEDRVGYNLSIGLAGKLGKHFYLKTVIGSNDFRNEVDLKWGADEIDYEILGLISIEQRYIEILPEFRFFNNNWLYFNMGMGFNQIKSAKLSEGIYSRNSELFYANESFPGFGGKYEYFIGHIGLNFSFSNLGIILEFGYRASGFTEFSSHTPGIGINQKSFNFGVSYRIK